MLCDRRSFLGAVAGAALIPRLALGQERRLRIVVPFAAGSGTDVGARVLAQAINLANGQTVIVENKPGAGSVIGSMDVVRSRPDGSTLLYTTGGHTTNAVLMKSPPFDAVTDFTPITLLTRSSGFALLVGANSPFQAIDELIAAARAQPGRLTYGSSGIGNTTHVMGALFCTGVGVDLLHVPFKGTPTNELIGGVVDCAFLSPTVAAQQIRGGQIRALGISGAKRSPMLPETPTFAEAGLEVQDLSAWSGIFGPPGMPPDIVQSLYESIRQAAQLPLLQTHVRENGGEVEVMPPEPFKAYVASEIERYRALLPPLNIALN